MILPNVRASFGRAEAGYVLHLLGGEDEAARAHEETRMREAGFDTILDDPRTLNALLSADGISTAPSGLAFYVLARHALLERGLHDRVAADYLAALLVEFQRQDRVHRIDRDDGREFFYLADIVGAMDSAGDRRAFLLRVHLGNFALWLSGLFPDRITAWVQRRGAPGLDYYEHLGATGYRLAADSRHAERCGLDHLFRNFAETFPELRTALNGIADRYLFPAAGDPVDRLLRQVADGFRDRLRHQN